MNEEDNDEFIDCEFHSAPNKSSKNSILSPNDLSSSNNSGRKSNQVAKNSENSNSLDNKTTSSEENNLPSNLLTLQRLPLARDFENSLANINTSVDEATGIPTKISSPSDHLMSILQMQGANALSYQSGSNPNVMGNGVSSADSSLKNRAPTMSTDASNASRTADTSANVSKADISAIDAASDGASKEGREESEFGGKGSLGKSQITGNMSGYAGTSNQRGTSLGKNNYSSQNAWNSTGYYNSYSNNAAANSNGKDWNSKGNSKGYNANSAAYSTQQNATMTYPRHRKSADEIPECLPLTEATSKPPTMRQNKNNMTYNGAENVEKRGSQIYVNGKLLPFIGRYDDIDYEDDVGPCAYCTRHYPGNAFAHTTKMCFHLNKNGKRVSDPTPDEQEFPCRFCAKRYPQNMYEHSTEMCFHLNRNGKNFIDANKPRKQKNRTNKNGMENNGIHSKFNPHNPDYSKYDSSSSNQHFQNQQKARHVYAKGDAKSWVERGFFGPGTESEQMLHMMKLVGAAKSGSMDPRLAALEAQRLVEVARQNRIIAKGHHGPSTNPTPLHASAASEAYYKKVERAEIAAAAASLNEKFPGELPLEASLLIGGNSKNTGNSLVGTTSKNTTSSAVAPPGLGHSPASNENLQKFINESTTTHSTIPGISNGSTVDSLSDIQWYLDSLKKNSSSHKYSKFAGHDFEEEDRRAALAALELAAFESPLKKPTSLGAFNLRSPPPAHLPPPPPPGGKNMKNTDEDDLNEIFRSLAEASDSSWYSKMSAAEKQNYELNIFMEKKRREMEQAAASAQKASAEYELAASALSMGHNAAGLGQYSDGMSTGYGDTSRGHFSNSSVAHSSLKKSGSASQNSVHSAGSLAEHASPSLPALGAYYEQMQMAGKWNENKGASKGSNGPAAASLGRKHWADYAGGAGAGAEYDVAGYAAEQLI